MVWCCITRNLYIFVSDSFGLLCAIWMTFSLYPHASLKVGFHTDCAWMHMHATCVALKMLYSMSADPSCIMQQVQNQLNAFIILAAGLWCILALTTMLLQDLGSPASIAMLWGWAVSSTQVVLMASPLSGLIEAVRARSSANFHLGVCIMNFLSCAMWTLYSVVSCDKSICMDLSEFMKSTASTSIMCHSTVLTCGHSFAADDQEPCNWNTVCSWGAAFSTRAPGEWGLHPASMHSHRSEHASAGHGA